MLPAPTDKKAGLAYWANRVLDECDQASSGFAADPVHDLRVAIRRCRSMADGFMSVDPDPAWKQMKRLAKPLFSSLGELRDVQVMLEWIGKLSPPNDAIGAEIAATLLQKEQHLKAAAKEALAVLDRKRWASLNAHLATRTGNVPLEGLVFQHLALERWLEARELHRRALRNRSALAWHQLRIGIKRFRYTVENFLPRRHQQWSRDLRDLQDALGEVHDFDVMRAMISGQPGIHADERVRWLRLIAAEREKRLTLYRQKMVGPQSLWQSWRAELPSGTALEEAALEKLRSWASFLDPDVEHSTQVAHLAMQLYDGLSQCGILHPQQKSRAVLQAAAFLHEIGRSRAASKRHQRRGVQLLSKLRPPLGWTEDDMRWVAALVRHHRGALPSTADISHCVGQDGKRRAELLRLMGMLRLANAFDESHRGTVRDLDVSRKGDAVVIGARGLRRISREAERAARARYLLETVFRRPLLIRALRTAQPQTPTARTRAARAPTS